jgi:hypothetical protein
VESQSKRACFLQARFFAMNFLYNTCIMGKTAELKWPDLRKKHGGELACCFDPREKAEP